MDRRQARAGFLIAPALLLLAAADSRRLPVREARWLKSNDLVSALTTQPPECLALPRDPASRNAVMIGRAAFRSPLLLGGQAARAGLSCASCHRNGRGNPDFHFPGISGESGTADVTASLLSSHRGDGQFNPVPIPDLSGDPAGFKVSRGGQGGALRSFIRGLIVEEFDGPEPPQAVLDGVTSYVLAIGRAACPATDSVPLSLENALADVDRAVRSAARADKGTAHVMIAAARSALGSIDERFQQAGLERERNELRLAAAELARIERSEAITRAWLARWNRDWPRRKRALLAAERRSLYAPDALRQTLAQHANPPGR